MHRRYVTEAELCTSDYKLDESDSRGIWGGLKSLAGASMQTTPESTWAKVLTSGLFVYVLTVSISASNSPSQAAGCTSSS